VMRREMFATYLVLIVGGLLYFIVVGLLHR
jgi:hypothetical protein